MLVQISNLYTMSSFFFSFLNTKMQVELIFRFQLDKKNYYILGCIIMIDDGQTFCDSKFVMPVIIYHM
jgi:hypothetical protein